LALNYNSHRKQFARVARMFVHDPRGDWLCTFQAGAWIEIGALTAAVKISLAL
jgi:hypothetical protein